MQLLRRFWRWLQRVVPFGLLVRHQAAPLPRDAARPVATTAAAGATRCASCARRLRRLLARPARPARRRHPRRAPVPDAPRAARAQHHARHPRRRARRHPHAARDVERGAAPPRPRALSAAARAAAIPAFARISWEEATRLAAERARADATGDRMALLRQLARPHQRGLLRVQKLARIAGTPHVDSCARLCHAASTVGPQGDASAGARRPARSSD